jgi:hypothetical protein
LTVLTVLTVENRSACRVRRSWVVTSSL